MEPHADPALAVIK